MVSSKLTDILGGDFSRVVFIHDVPRLLNHLLTSFSELVTQASQELVVGDIAVAIHVVVLHERLEIHLLRKKTDR